MSTKLKKIIEALEKLTIEEINQVANWLENLTKTNEDV